jgi:phage terminase large subunit GpA-like protein
VNTFLAETWEAEGDSLEAGDIMNRVEDYGPQLPEGVLVLTIGADVQKDRIEAEVIGWGDGEENWGIKLGRFMGDTERPEVYEQFGKFCRTEFEHPKFGKMRAAIVCCDARHRTDHVYRFVRENQELNAFAVMGAQGQLRRPVMIPTHRSRSTAMQVDTHHFKTAIYSRLAIKAAGARFNHFPREYDEEYFLQLTAEKLRKRFVRGFAKQEWEVVRGNKRNEALDIRVYNHAGLFILNPDWSGLKNNLAKFASKVDVAPISNANTNLPPQKKLIRPQLPALRRGNGFVGGWR